MSFRTIHSVLLCLFACAALQPSQAQTNNLRSPEEFASVSDRADRSRALFNEMGKVLQSPRCVNCHPNGDTPTQGNDLHTHIPPVTRGVDNRGALGMRCMNCHQAVNFESSRVPGNPKWQIAPREMAWHGKPLAEICEQIKDPARNGNRSLEKIREHMGKDDLVGWAWQPGANRVPAPGTQEQFDALIAEWIRTGAVCPAK